MTTLASWAGIDSRGVASLYVVSDSRFTYAASGKIQTDQGQKIYTCIDQPHIFGYCGWVDFPAKALQKLTTEIDAGAVFDSSDNIEVRQGKLAASMKERMNTMLATVKLPPNLSFSVLHAAREGTGLDSCFGLWLNRWAKSSGWTTERLTLRTYSDLIYQDGSGAAALLIEHGRWQKSDVCETSRAVFSAFCDALTGGKDPYTGGAPQLTGLFRNSSGRDFGIVYGGKLYFRGKQIKSTSFPPALESFNEAFERCDPSTTKRLPNAQRQARPWRSPSKQRHLP